jgi:hypothetical protein
MPAHAFPTAPSRAAAQLPQRDFDLGRGQVLGPCAA